MYTFDYYGNFASGDMLEYILNFIHDEPHLLFRLGEDVLGEYNCEMCYNCNYNYNMED